MAKKRRAIREIEAGYNFKANMVRLASSLAQTIATDARNWMIHGTAWSDQIWISCSQKYLTMFIMDLQFLEFILIFF